MTELSTRLVPRLRLHVYEVFARTGGPPSPLELCERFDLTPDELTRALQQLEREADALVLLPGTSLIWMAEPFSAVPTLFPVRSGVLRWYGNCVWDGLAILALLDRDGDLETSSPLDGRPLRLSVRGGELRLVNAVVHFAVPARDWWRSIGFT